MAKKAAKATQFTSELSAAAPKKALEKGSVSRTQKHLKAQASGVVAAVEGFVNAITNTPVEEKAPVPEVAATPVSAPAASVKEVTDEEIRVLAYTFYLNRRAEGGSEAEDWLRAEQTLRAS